MVELSLLCLHIIWVIQLGLQKKLIETEVGFCFFSCLVSQVLNFFMLVIYITKDEGFYLIGAKGVNFYAPNDLLFSSCEGF